MRTGSALKKAASSLLSLTLAVTMILSAPIFPHMNAETHSYASSGSGISFSDMSGHWAEEYVNKAVLTGFVQGYSNNTFKPDQAITRAEFTKMLNSAIGNNGTTSIDFWDVSPSSWYYNDVKKGVSAGYINGHSETRFMPDNLITRQEAAVMLARIVPAYGSSSTLKAFSDYDKAGDWATTALEKMVAKGYISGYSNGSLQPQSKLTRAQAAKMIVSILDNENIVSNNQTVVLTGVTLSNTIYANRISVGEDVDGGTATLENCTVLGTLNVEGGGSNTNEGVTVSNSRVANLEVHKRNTPVRVYARGESTVKETNVENQATLESGRLSGKNDYGQGFINVDIARAAEVALIGDFNNVEVTGAKVDMSVADGSVKNLTVNAGASQTNIDIKDTGNIAQADINAEQTVFSGQGTITRLNANANGIIYEREPNRVTVGSGVSIRPVQSVNAERFLTITSDPADGATGISTGEEVQVIFSSVVHIRGLTTNLSDSQAKSIVKLRQDSPNGTTVDCAVSVSNDFKKVILTPTKNLAQNKTYYITIASGELADNYGNTNAQFTSRFTTGMTSMDTAFWPADGATNVSLSAIPTITFSDSLTRYANGSSSITPQYLQEEVLSFQKRGPSQTNRSNVNFTASVDSSNKIITITPREHFDEETEYFITLNKNTLRKADGTAIEGATATFTTVANSLSNRTLTALPYNEEDRFGAKASFTALQKGTVYGIIFPAEELSGIRPTAEDIKNHAYLASVSSNPKHYASVDVRTQNTYYDLKFGDLEANTEYYMFMVLYDDEGAACNVFYDTVTTGLIEPALSGLSIATTKEVSDGGSNAPTQGDYIPLSLTGESTFYIGSGTTALYLQTEATGVPNENFRVTADNLGDVKIRKGDTDKPSSEIHIIEIPSSSDNGKITVRLTSGNADYGSKTYTINIVRINPGIDEATNINETRVNLYDTEAGVQDDKSIQDIPIANGANIDLAVILAEKTNASGITFVVERRNEDGAGWTPVTVVNGNTVTLGNETNKENLGGIYRIRTTSKVIGLSPAEGIRKENVERYMNLRFIDAVQSGGNTGGSDDTTGGDSGNTVTE